MNIRNTTLCLIGATVFVALLFLTINASRTTDVSYENWLSSIRNVSRAGTAMDAAMLTSRANRQSNYDVLNTLSQELRDTAKIIKKLTEAESSFLSPVLVLDGQELIDIVERHNQLVFDFQTELSTLNAATTVFLNSIHEFVLKSEQLDTGMLTMSLMLVEEILLINTRKKFEEKRKFLNRQITDIEKDFPEITQLNSGLWASIVDDAKAILWHTRNLDTIISEEKKLRETEQNLITQFFVKATEAHLAGIIHCRNIFYC